METYGNGYPLARDLTPRLVPIADLASFDLRPPIHRFLERWTPGDPFVHLGQLWAR